MLVDPLVQPLEGGVSDPGREERIRQRPLPIVLGVPYLLTGGALSRIEAAELDTRADATPTS